MLRRAEYGAFDRLLAQGERLRSSCASVRFETPLPGAIVAVVCQGRSCVITIVAYDERWPEEFRRIAEALKASLGALALRVDHIGSTSVPGLSAKDVIDVQITVRQLDQAIAGILARAGLVQRPHSGSDHVPPGCADNPELWRKFLFVSAAGDRRAHIHVRKAGMPNQRYALLFRDYLRAHPAAAMAYAELKRRLAARLREPGDYAEVKDPAVDLIYFAAEAWAAR